MKAFLAELCGCPSDIVTLETRGGAKPLLSDVISDILEAVKKTKVHFEKLTSDYEKVAS